ncbi:MAG TPA: crossover junction endodeoxyribonuclease RuvC [Aestuariivirgaceae bacterium]|nr:crossover junction endodeoxyribonuclease RuvC [Aestuariivirgaceae bacterium]
MPRIIGLDPGLRNAGWGVIDSEGSRLVHVADGVVRADPTLPTAERLNIIYKTLVNIIGEYRPDEAAIEETFVSKDARATLKLGQARGIAMLAPAAAGVPVFEYAPNQIKKTVVGVGHADKAQIHHMLKMLLPKAKPQSPDAADALAIAICHAHQRGGMARLRA